jgi:hypothetical protein
MYRTLGFSFICLVLGILIGGALIALLPHHNTIHLTVMPYQGVNISPEVGDTIEWAAYGQKTPPTITFSPFTGSPCRDQSPGSSCVYNEKGNGIYIYSCSGSTTCDPGMGPGSGTKGGNGGIFNPIALLLQGVVFDIDRALGLIATDQAPAASPSTAVASPAPALQPALHPADGSNPDGQVGCINGATSINNSSISKTVGQSISWVGGSSFAITVDQSICQGNMSTPSPFQSCKVMKPAPPTAYTITNASCTTQPTLNTPTITALAATPAMR